MRVFTTNRVLKLTILAVLFLVFLITPLITNAQWGGSADDWGPDCCGTDTAPTTSPRPTPRPDPTPDRPDRDRPDRPNLSCTIDVTKTTITQGESTELTVNSIADSAILYKQDGWRRTFFGLIRARNYVRISDIPLGTPYSISPTETTNYEVRVRKPRYQGGVCRTTINVIDTPSPQHQYPSCNVWATPNSIQYGGSTTLHWSSNNATGMSIPSIGSLTPNITGSKVFYNLTSDRTFECTAYDADGHVATDTTSVSVEQYNYTPPMCTLFASPLNITKGGDSTLTWSTTNATSVTLTDLGSAPLNGSRVLYNLQGSKTYTLTATGPGGATTCTRRVNVTEPYQPPVVPPTKVRPSCQIYPVYVNRDITANGGGAILQWTAQNAATATLTDHGSVNSVTGTQFVKPTESKMYTLTVFNDGFRASCSTYITVAQRTITDYSDKYVNLTSVPYTGAEDYVTLILLTLALLTLSFIAFFYRHHIKHFVARK